MNPPDYGKMIRDAVAAAEKRIVQKFRNIIQQTTINNPTADGNEDGADNWPDAGRTSSRSPRRWQHFGFRSVPPRNTPALMILVGGGSSAEVTIAEDGQGYGPDPGPEGAAFYSSASGAYITIDKSGQMVLSVPAGKLVESGGSTDFALKGTTYRNAQNTLDTALSTFIAAIAAHGTAIGVTLPALAPAGATLATAATAAALAVTTFEGAATTYLSTVNKLG